MDTEFFKTVFPQSHQPVETLIWLIIFLGAGIVLGFTFELILKKVGFRWASMTKWQIDDFLMHSVQGTLLPLTIVISFFLSTIMIPDLMAMQILLNKISFSSAAFIITLIIARFLSKAIRHYSSTAHVPIPASLLSNLSSVLVFIIGTLVALQTLGISITPILTTLGIGGLAVALALQDTLANLFSGVYILLSKQVRIGDYVKLDSGNEGYISDITWRNSVIKTLGNNLIIIPNSKLASAIITNFSLPVKEITFSFDIGVGYESDLSKVETVTKETVTAVLATFPNGITTFEPLVRFHTFGPSSINFSIVMRACEYVDQYQLKHECIKKLHERYKIENIVIPYPIQTIYLQQPGDGGRIKDIQAIGECCTPAVKEERQVEI
jgi:small-conductance mechanosensitive channel